MNTALSVASAKSNPGGAISGSQNAEMGFIQSVITNWIKALRPTKPWAAAAEIFQLEESVAKKRMAGTRRYSADELAIAIRTERGFDLIVGLMGEDERLWPRWWKWVRLIKKTADARRARARIANELNEALNADADLMATIGRADAALAVQDEDFMRPHVDAMRAVGGLQNRPMAPGAKVRARG